MKSTIAILATLFAATTFNVAAAEGDPAAGEKVFRKCKACHVVDSDQNRVGPSLQGLIGRQPGTIDGFKYSNAMIEFGDGKVWDEELLTVYLAKPREMVKGTRMAFAGLRKDEEIADIIAYLKQYSPSE
ncbi:c-type cytochrome [Roseibium sp.]|uniref:c-type cytochrome n=1 Tax=Roseibium sp. TaxID=1936156 RepID=UPI003BABD684